MYGIRREPTLAARPANRVDTPSMRAEEAPVTTMPAHRRSTRRRVAQLFAAGMLAVGTAAATAGYVPPAQAAGTTTTQRPTRDLVRNLRADLETYLRTHGATEHASAIGLSINLPGRAATIDIAAGTTRFGGSRPLSTASVWQIGSNTKAFSAVLLLQLEAGGRLSIEDTVGRWLPQYPQWSGVTIRQLLNMTSGIPTYEEQTAFLTTYTANPYTHFSKETLIEYAAAEPPTTGYSYSNTNYALAEMILEKVTGESYERLLYRRIITPLGLRDTHYRPNLYPAGVRARMPAGYFFMEGIPPLASILGDDVGRHTLSWARGAGGIVATIHDMTVWERALYGTALLPATQRAKLFSLVSIRTGQPIDRTSLEDPHGFGLGVGQSTLPGMGTFWTYLGGTLGFRTRHVYLPDSGLIFALGINSQVVGGQFDTLIPTIYDRLVAHRLVRR
jgi:D-alanyl-D-alanine carboxypeptidase